MFASCSNALDKGIKYYNKQNFTKAQKYFREAAEQGNAEAMAWVGLCFDQRGIKYIETAKKWYKKGIEKGAIQWFLDKAEEGIPEIQAQLGYCYLNGHGVEKNYDKAVYWSQLSAKSDNPRAQYNLSAAYRYGLGVKKDQDKVMEYLNKSAEQKYVAAERDLGVIYFGQNDDMDIPADTTQSLYWLDQAANQNDALAQSYLGGLYLQIDDKKEQAFYWLNKSSLAGEVSAYNNLGYCYATGTGTKQNLKSALHWYQKSIDNVSNNKTMAMQNFVFNAYAIWNQIDEDQRKYAKEYLSQLVEQKNAQIIKFNTYLEKINSRIYTGNIPQYNPNDINTYSLAGNRYLATLDEYKKFIYDTDNIIYEYTPDNSYCWITAYERDKYNYIFQLANPFGRDLAVDLGLSVKWASKNIGANDTYDLGDRFAWGETSPKDAYTWITYKYAKGSSETFIPIGHDIKGTKYDAATVNWGKYWRMPTIAEYNELIQKCSFEWVKNDDYRGIRVTGPNDNTLFFPCSSGFFGANYSTSQDGATSFGGSDISIFEISNSSYGVSEFGLRYAGNYIRAVFVE